MRQQDDSMHRPMGGSTPQDTTAALPAVAITMGQAVVAAYQAFENPQTAVSPPSGWQNVGSVYGWVSQGNVPELFGLWFQNTADTDTYLLALRGTVSSADQYADIDYATTSFSAFTWANTPDPTPQVHSGFWGIYSGLGTLPASMQTQLFEFLQNHTISTLYVTGHSLGGALAELFALDLAASAPPGAPAATTITFAAPKVGLQDSWGTAFASYTATANALRVVNQYDQVPNLPPSWLAPNYAQVGQEFDVLFYYQQPWVPGMQELTIRHEMDNYLQVVNNAQPLTPQVWAGTFTDGVYPDITDTSATPSASVAARTAEALARLPREPISIPGRGGRTLPRLPAFPRSA